MRWMAILYDEKSKRRSVASQSNGESCRGSEGGYFSWLCLGNPTPFFILRMILTLQFQLLERIKYKIENCPPSCLNEVGSHFCFCTFNKTFVIILKTLFFFFYETLHKTLNIFLVLSQNPRILTKSQFADYLNKETT